MNKQDAVTIIENTFMHLEYEKDIKVGDINVLIYFPTAGIAVLEESAEPYENKSVVDLTEHLIRRQLSAEVVYLNLHEEGFNIGYVINDILLTAEFIPTVDVSMEEGTTKE